MGVGEVFHIQQTLREDRGCLFILLQTLESMTVDSVLIKLFIFF